MGVFELELLIDKEMRQTWLTASRSLPVVMRYEYDYSYAFVPLKVERKRNQTNF